MAEHDPFAQVADVYDIMIDWTSRLARERPFFARQVEAIPVRRALDVGCGSGGHARMLAEMGVEVVAIDPSEPMLVQARAAAAGDNPRFLCAGFADIAGLGGNFDLITILGNTLAHVRDDAELGEVLRACRAGLTEKGKLVIQVVNYDAIRLRGDRRLPLLARQRDGHEFLFIREYRQRGAKAEFSITTMAKGDEGWQMHLERTLHLPLTAARLRRSLRYAGFTNVEMHGDYAGTPYDPEKSGALVVTAG